LLRAPGLGAKRLRELVTEAGSAAALVHQPPACTPEALRDYLRNPDRAGAAADLEWLAGDRHSLLTFDDPDYPARLEHAGNPPAALFLNGDTTLLDLPQVAVVGSRNPSAGGRSNAEAFAAFLAASGLVVASGLARGIDAAAHRGALAADGLTLAVTGTGPDRVYPAANRALAHEIAANGLLVSEFPTGTPPLPANFPRRNRILAGLSLGTLVIEAAPRSGSLITARLAADAGREVFAIPGSIHNPLARGCHALIREGAKLVETGEHVLEELAPLLRTAPPTAGPQPQSTDDEPADPQHQAVIEALGHDPLSTDELVRRTGFPAREVSSILLLLELQGHVSSEPGGLFARVGKRRE
jgi:DNA processing protein